MKAAQIKFNLVESYLELLQSLSAEAKKELAARLSVSSSRVIKSNADIRTLFGSFVSDLSAEEQIEVIRQSRKFTRQIPEL